MSQATRFSGVNHISITVRDMDRSIHFYRDCLGLAMTLDTEVADRASATPAYVQKHAKRRMATFQIPEGPVLALISHPGDALTGEGVLLDQVGITHFSIVVADIAALNQHMASKGCPAVAPGFFRDPDGVLVQFEEPSHVKRAMEYYQGSEGR